MKVRAVLPRTAEADIIITMRQCLLAIILYSVAASAAPTVDSPASSISLDGVRAETLQLCYNATCQILPPDRQPAAEECPTGWSRHQDSCFLIPAQTSSWHLAHHHCAMMEPRARLASVHQWSRRFIEEMVRSFDAPKAVWVGLARLSTATDWMWSDATGVDYLNWGSRQPDNSELDLCAHLGWLNMPKEEFHDNRCDVVHNILCQIDLK